jgi:hypothetical protein
MTILATIAHRGGQVTIPKTSGGCGRVHAYEDTPDGYPGITCSACEDVLAKDPQHAKLASEVPETFDETRLREAAEKTGRKERDDVTARALAAIAGMTAAAPVAVAGPACQAGHQNPVGAKFCGHCGTAMAGPASCPGGHQVAPGMRYCGTCGLAAVPPVPSA